MFLLFRPCIWLILSIQTIWQELDFWGPWVVKSDSNMKVKHSFITEIAGLILLKDATAPTLQVRLKLNNLENGSLLLQDSIHS